MMFIGPGACRKERLVQTPVCALLFLDCFILRVSFWLFCLECFSSVCSFSGPCFFRAHSGFFLGWFSLGNRVFISRTRRPRLSGSLCLGSKCCLFRCFFPRLVRVLFFRCCLGRFLVKNVVYSYVLVTSGDVFFWLLRVLDMLCASFLRASFWFSCLECFLFQASQGFFFGFSVWNDYPADPMQNVNLSH